MSIYEQIHKQINKKNPIKDPTKKQKDETNVPFLGLGSTICFEDKEEEDTEADKLLEDPGYNSGIRMESKRKEDKMIFLIAHRFRIFLMR